MALALVVALMVYGALMPGRPRIATAAGMAADRGDAALHRAILTRMRGGEGYYSAAGAEHRARNYPLRPFVTVRLPTLATLSTALGARTLPLLQVLAILATIAMVLRIRDAGGSIVVTASVTVLASLAAAFPASIPLFHEAWASLLTLLALAVWSRRTWGLSLMIALLAVLMRELTAPFLLVMGLMAVSEKQWREATGWAVGLATVGIVMVLHAMRVAAVLQSGDVASPGWVAAGGWPFVVTMVHESTVLLFLPRALTAILLPLALLGWWHLRHPLASRAIAYLLLFLGSCLVVGRPDNTYWGILPGPLLIVGLVFAPSAVYSLWRRADS